ncbi:MAG: hypothetical protein AAGG06_18650 [Pseudomonadota bacterium]
MLKVMLAMPILALARAIPIVRMNSFMRSFCSAKECSTADRIFERATFALSWCAGIGLPGGPRKWTFEASPARAIFFSFFCDRYAVSAHTFAPVFDLSSRPPSP